MKKVLILGAGMVAAPIINFLINKGYFVSVASNNAERATQLLNNAPKSNFYNWDADDLDSLDKLIKEHHIVVSLLPYKFHVQVAEVCIKHKKNMVTTSYVQPEMKKLDKAAKDAGIIILNECGLDPGIDHMSAKSVIDTVHGLGGKIEQFYSICGALPAPEHEHDNPFGYKFSWSPKGVIQASNNDALYLKNEEKISVKSIDLFKNPFSIDVSGVGALDVYPNRDSIPYIKLYGIPETKTMYRGTFRYKGWCDALDALKALKLTSTKQADYSDMSFAQLLAKHIGISTTKGIVAKTAKKLEIETDHNTINAFEFLGLFSDEPLNRGTDSAFNIISDIMIDKMMLKASERDMSVLKHIFLAKYPDGKQEVITSKLIDFGEPNGDTSIARTVALPAACAVKMILDNEINMKGVHIPVLPDIYIPILHELEHMGFEIVEEYGLSLSHLPG